VRPNQIQDFRATRGVNWRTAEKVILMATHACTRYHPHGKWEFKEKNMRYCRSSNSATSAWTRAFLLIVALCLFASGPASAQTSDSATLSGHVPMKVQNGWATLVGHYNSNQMLRLGLAVQAPHMAEEEQFIKELVTKGSPNFHKFLTADEWNARFAPAVEDEQKVVDWAKSQGLTVTARHPDRLMVDVEAPAGVIEKVFGVTINNYQVGDEVDFSNDRDPAIPASLSGILHTVLGLNSIERVRRIGSGKSKTTTKGADYVPGPVYSVGENSHGDGDPTRAPAKRATAKQAGATMSKPTPSDSYPLSGGVANPDNIQSSEGYDYNALQRLSFCCNEPGAAGGSPPESSIALVGYGNYNNSDVTTFFGYYGLAWNISGWCIGGGSCPAVDSEAPLDVEYSDAMSNSYGSYLDTAQVIEYEMTNNLYTTYYNAWNAILTNNTAKVASTSYGWEENVGFSGSVATGTMHPLFNTMVGQGFTLLSASGDNGASVGCGDNTAALYPATDPDFIAAGGTQLLLDSSGVFVSETAWQGESWSGACSSNHGGSSGGRSVLFSAPSWQGPIESPYYEWIGSTEYIVTGNTNRLTPDISLTANPDVMGEWYYSGGSWQDEGGTSIVAPELAGFFAQENSYLDWIGNVCGAGSSACSPVGLASPFIYYDAIDGAPHNPFYDMTSGCNNNDNTAFWGLVYYCAGTGYDLVTGWGSANMLQLAWGINWELIPAYGSPSLVFSGPTVYNWYNTDQEVSWTLSDAGSGGFPAPGVAGFTQGWDSIPTDPYSEPNGGDGNSFYWGPEYAYGTTGCLSFNGSFGCAGGSGQGMHTVQVEGWDNQGRTTFGSYGPIGYDTIPPVTTAGLSGTLISGTTYKSAVTVTLTASDPGYPSTGSGVVATYYYLNGGGWQLYGGPFTVPYIGSYTVHFESIDNAGNYETIKSKSFTIKPVLSLSAATLAFGNEVLGTTSAGKAVTITNITSSSVSISSIAAAGDFTITANTCPATLAGSGHCIVTVAFKPSVLGATVGDLTIAYGAIGSPDRLGLTGTGLVPLTASPTSLAFGTITVGTTSAPKTVTLKNDNPSTTLSIGVSTNGDYAVASGGTCGATLAGGASCTVNVTFKPHQNGAINGEVTVTDGVSLSPLVVGMSGSGSGGVANPLTFTPASLSYTTVVVGASAMKTVTVKNASAQPVTVSSVSASGDYSASGCITTLIPAATCVLTVTFSPSTNGTIKGAIALTDTTTVSPEVLDASGTAILPVTLSPATLSFGGWTVGTSSGTPTVTVTNHTASAISLAIAASGDFAAGGGTCGASLGAGASCTVGVTFTPTTTGAISGVATVTYSGGYSPLEVKLSGTGQ